MGISISFTDTYDIMLMSSFTSPPHYSNSYSHTLGGCLADTDWVILGATSRIDLRLGFDMRGALILALEGYYMKLSMLVLMLSIVSESLLRSLPWLYSICCWGLRFSYCRALT